MTVSCLCQSGKSHVYCMKYINQFIVSSLAFLSEGYASGASGLEKSCCMTFAL